MVYARKNKKSIEFGVNVVYNVIINVLGYFMVEVIITACLIYMILLVASFIIKLACGDRESRLRLVKGYSKGRFILIYIAAVPLFLIACLSDGAGVVESIFEAVKASVNLVVLKLDYEVVEMLAESNLYFFVTMVVLFVLCLINALMFTLALFYQRISNGIYIARATRKEKVTYVVVGKNAKNRDILTSIEGSKIWLIEEGEKDTAFEEFAYVNKVAIAHLKDGKLDVSLKRLFKDFSHSTVRVIINSGSDEQNLLYTEEVSEIIKESVGTPRDIDDLNGLHVYVFGEPENSSAFLHFVKKTCGQVKYVNKYKLIAFDFVDKHPLTEYMDDEIDFSSATIKEDVDLNVVMIGFNKTMQEILSTSIANNQFLTIDKKGDLQAKSVRYSIFSKDKTKGDKNLNDTVLRYSLEKEDLDENKSNYLPLPSLPAMVDFVPSDVKDDDFYRLLKGALSPMNEGNRTFNQVIISYAGDIENVDIGEKISNRIKEWGFDENTKVFVKIRNKALAEKIVKEEYKEICELYAYGVERDVIYNLDRIVNEKIEGLARDRHLAYATLDAVQDGKDQEKAKIKALEKWYGWAQPQRDANVYGALSIRMKLHLLGFDYDNGSMNDAIVKEFDKKYQDGDEIVYKENIIGGKKIVEYSNDFVKGTLRERMAIQEHLRWNAYMITQGIIPSSKEEIVKEGGKNLTLRRHGCLTTFDGLKEYRKIMANRNETNEEREDVIRYDYQLLDDVVWLLERNGKKLIRR